MKLLYYLSNMVPRFLWQKKYLNKTNSDAYTIHLFSSTPIYFFKFNHLILFLKRRSVQNTASDPEHNQHYAEAQGVHRTFPIGRRQGNDIGWFIQNITSITQKPKAFTEPFSLDGDKVKTSSYWLIYSEHNQHHPEALGVHRTFPIGRRQGKDIFLLVDLSRTVQAPARSPRNLQNLSYWTATR
jgi:hypothetical protein